MMKLVVLALALSTAYAASIYTASYPGVGLTYAGGHVLNAGLPLVHGTVHTPLTHVASPVTYTAVDAPALVAPSPYRVHTGVKTVVETKPVEQHGYVIKY